jgi:siroheme synthase-like protein
MDKASVNLLYPAFFRLDRVNMLIVGGGEVALEKLHFILKSSPNAQIDVVAPDFNPQVDELIKKYPSSIQKFKKPFDSDSIQDHQLVVAATNISSVNKEVYRAAKLKRALVNVADTPELCDFYMGSIVTRGDLKIAISTNGKSPTFSKRFRQLLERILPEETSDLLLNLKMIRDSLEGNFAFKVKRLNQITKSLITE